MERLKVKMLAYNGAPAEVFERGKKQILKYIQADKMEFVEQQPEVLYFLSGGSEREAVSLTEGPGFYILLATQADNSYASATEVKAYLNAAGRSSVLLDLEDAGTIEFLDRVQSLKKGLDQLQNQKLGLIGTVSDWLIASHPQKETLRERLGIELKQILWEDLPFFRDMETSGDFLKAFDQVKNFQLDETSRVYQLLRQTVKNHELDALTVECFSMVNAHDVTACLPLARLNDEGIPAGCEGDIVSAAGLMFAKALTGRIPWMANTVKVSPEKSFFAHCTVPTNLLKSFTVKTHFETNKGTAIQGEFIGDEITLFRFNSSLDRFFITRAKVVNRPQLANACRTQVEVELPENAIQLLRDQPLGNHHLLLPGDYHEDLKMAAQLLGVSVLDGGSLG